jgi:surface protein
MFQNCSVLTELDISNWNTSILARTKDMFRGCQNLKTIYASDKFVRSAVIKQLSKWKNKYGFVLPVSVNVSRSDVLEQTFEYSLNVLMEEYEVDRDSLIIEINENSLIENANQFVTILKRLRNHGYKIELDDFGNGFLSLKILSLVTFDVLKIDGSLLENIENNEKNELFFKIVIGLAKNLDMFVIAEGVETENQLDFLKEVGCSCAQGFYLSKPLLANEFEDLIFKKEK